MADRLRDERETKKEGMEEMALGGKRESVSSASSGVHSSGVSGAQVAPVEGGEGTGSEATPALNGEPVPEPSADQVVAKKHWKKVKMAQQMNAAFKQVDNDVKMYGAKGNDEHINWNEVMGHEETKEEKSMRSKYIIDPHGKHTTTHHNTHATLTQHTFMLTQYTSH